jgi:hypothetical protein
MLTTLVLMAGLQVTAQQDAGLRLTNPVLSHSALRVPRQNAEVLPGDMIFLCFDIEGLKESADGRVQYAIGMELRNKDNKLVFEQKPQKAQALNSLGGGKLPGFARADIGDTPAGEYAMTVAVIDNNTATKAKQEIAQKFTVLPKALGIVSLSLSYDPENKFAAPALGVPGQYLFVNFGVIGFQRDKDKKPHFICEMRVLDESGKAVLEKPFSGTVTDVPPQANIFPAQFLVSLNRSGKFKVELKVADKVANKEETKTIDLTVQVLR